MYCCFLNDGSREYINVGSADQDVQFRRVIEEKLGHDMATCFDELLIKHCEKIEENSYAYFEKKVTLIQNRIDMLISHFDEYLNLPDQAKNVLRVVKTEMNDMLENFDL